MQTTQDKIESLMHRMKARLERFNKQQRSDREEYHRLQQQLQREALTELMGKPGAVETRSRFPVGDKAHKLNGLVGTLREIRRTRCVVEFPGAGRWDFAIDDIIRAEVRR